jgi:hypothetical protein
MTTKLRATKRETQLYREWQASQQRVQMALGVLTGAQQASVAAEVTFKATAQLKHGPDATFEYDAGKQRLTFTATKSKATKGD